MAGTKGSSGGRRPGAGRKPKLLRTLLQEVPGAADDAEFAYGLFRDLMRDPNQMTDVRMDAAREVLNRLIGKPKQAVEVAGEDGGPLRVLVEYADADAHPDAPPAPPGPAGDPA